MSEVLNADNWRAKRQRPAVLALASLGGARVILRPMSALRKLELEKVSDNKDLFVALLADTACTGEADGDAVVSVGNPIWKPEEIVSDEFPGDALDELADGVLKYLGLRRSAEAKNFYPASDSPAVSP